MGEIPLFLPCGCPYCEVRSIIFFNLSVYNDKKIQQVETMPQEVPPMEGQQKKYNIQSEIITTKKILWNGKDNEIS